MNKTSAAALTLSASLLPLMGLLPHPVMDRLAVLGEGFMLVHTDSASETVSYFSPANLKGAAISLVIGALVYGIVVRLWMMRPTASGSSVKCYVDRWDKRLDLENLIYRPLLLKILPFLCGVLCRVLDSLVDGLVLLLRKTVYRDSRLPQELPEGTPLTHILACIAGFFRQIGNRTLWRKHPSETDYDHRFAMIHEEWSENSTMIARSMSFGLLLFCIGLIVMIGYLFVMDVF